MLFFMTGAIFYLFDSDIAAATLARRRLMFSPLPRAVSLRAERLRDVAAAFDAALIYACFLPDMSLSFHALRHDVSLMMPRQRYADIIRFSR